MHFHSSESVGIRHLVPEDFEQRDQGAFRPAAALWREVAAGPRLVEIRRDFDGLFKVPGALILGANESVWADVHRCRAESQGNAPTDADGLMER